MIDESNKINKKFITSNVKIDKSIINNTFSIYNVFYSVSGWGTFNIKSSSGGSRRYLDKFGGVKNKGSTGV